MRYGLSPEPRPPLAGIDLSRISAGQRQWLERIARPGARYMRVKGGYRTSGEFELLSVATVVKMKAAGLIREESRRGVRTLVVTGAGQNVLAVLEQRKAS